MFFPGKVSRREVHCKLFYKRPSLYYVSKRTGLVESRNGRFCRCSALYLCWPSGWVGQKSPKICWHNIGMVLNLSSFVKVVFPFSLKMNHILPGIVFWQQTVQKFGKNKEITILLTFLKSNDINDKVQKFWECHKH